MLIRFTCNFSVCNVIFISNVIKFTIFSFYEHNYGLSALHLAAFSGCTKSTNFLLTQKGCYVNLMCKCYSPLHCTAFGDNPEIALSLLEKGANIDAFTNDLHCNIEGVLHCAVRANAVQCLKLFCDKGILVGWK